MELEIILRGNRNHSNPCGGCIFLKGNDCDMPINFDYNRYGDCGERSSSVYVYRDKDSKCITGIVPLSEQRIRDAQIKEAIRLIETSEKTVKEISDELLVSRSTIYNRINAYIKKNNIDFVIPSKKLVSEKRTKSIVDMIAKGMTLKEVSDITGRSVKIISRVNREYLKREKDEMDKSKVG